MHQHVESCMDEYDIDPAVYIEKSEWNVDEETENVNETRKCSLLSLCSCISEGKKKKKKVLAGRKKRIGRCEKAWIHIYDMRKTSDRRWRVFSITSWPLRNRRQRWKKQLEWVGDGMKKKKKNERGVTQAIYIFSQYSLQLVNPTVTHHHQHTTTPLPSTTLAMAAAHSHTDRQITSGDVCSQHQIQSLRQWTNTCCAILHPTISIHLFCVVQYY